MQFKFLLGDINIGAGRKIPFAYVLWFLLPLAAVIVELFRHNFNNYLIFKNVFWHLIQQKDLYRYYPAEYEDHNLYGPVFSFVIAPMAVLPTWLGVILWVMFNAGFLFVAIKSLPLSEKAIRTIFLISAIECMTASHSVQFNPMIAAWIILSYTLVKEEKEFWATLFIALGITTKIYGVVGLLFFLFSQHKLTYILSFMFWLAVLFCLPMLISSPAFVIQSYKDWMHTLFEKNLLNVGNRGFNMQDISVMGMVRRIFKFYDASVLFAIIPAGLLLALPLLRFKLYKHLLYQLYYLAALLITVVIFSSSAESSTYVIAMVGVGIWYVTGFHKHSVLDHFMLAFAIFTTTLCTTDLVPRIIRHDLVASYALKALPCFIVWLMLIYNVSFAKDAALQSPAIVK